MANIITPKGIQGRNTINPNRILALDTATRYTGYAIYDAVPMTPPFFVLKKYGVVKGGGNPEFQVRCIEMSAKISTVVHEAKPGYLVMEFPTFYEGQRGQAAARGGATLELAFLCGKVEALWEGYIMKVHHDTGKMFRPSFLTKFPTWNGQLPKEVTCKRFTEKFKIAVDAATIENNFVDAVMMGKWFIEDMLKSTVGESQPEREDK
ncbi:MAG: hypothetical protein WC822_01595 [Candidatus Paceibacterota bacterium]|jgi:hypothetical protein